MRDIYDQEAGDSLYRGSRSIKGESNVLARPVVIPVLWVIEL